MISVIICTYNRDKYIFNVLESLAKNDYPKEDYEIVLVNNNCTDNTVAEVGRFAKDYPEIRLKNILETNQGLSFARNRGIQEAEGDILIFLDDDAFPSVDYLKNIAYTLSSHKEIDAFGGKIYPLFEDCRAPDWLCKWSFSWISAIDLGNELIPFGKKYPIGANMGFRKQVFGLCGNFSTSLGRNKKNLMGGEEKDLFLRIKKSGLGIYYIPEIGVRHIIPASRTTSEYVKRLGQGIGASEKMRCKSQGRSAYLKRIISECIKWAATLVLWFFYLIQGRTACGNMLVRFRWNVTKELLLS